MCSRQLGDAAFFSNVFSSCPVRNRSRAGRRVRGLAMFSHLRNPFVRLPVLNLPSERWRSEACTLWAHLSSSPQYVGSYWSPFLVLLDISKCDISNYDMQVKHKDQDPVTDNDRPLSSAALHILLALAESDLHGYGIMQSVKRQSGGTFKLGPGTLYANLDRLL